MGLYRVNHKVLSAGRLELADVALLLKEGGVSEPEIFRRKMLL